jgi:hypothetical protein
VGAICRRNGIVAGWMGVSVLVQRSVTSMAKKKQTVWLAVLSSGLAVAAFTFVANKAWDTSHHHHLAAKYVDTSLRFEDNKLLLFVRNNSDDSLDLTAAKIDIDDPELLQSPMGAYPDVSKVYDVSTTAGSAKLETDNDRLVVKLHITQAIPPRAADQFGVQIVGPAGPLDLSNVKFDVEIQDIKGHTYVVRH